MENQTVNSTNSQFVVTKSEKSLATSIILSILFAGLGLLYSTIQGGLVMLFMFFPGVIAIIMTGNPIIGVILLLCYYIGCVSWGINAVKKYNQKLLKGEDTSESIDFYTYGVVQFILFCAFSFCACYAFGDFLHTHF